MRRNCVNNKKKSKKKKKRDESLPGPAFAQFGEHERKPFYVIYYLYKMKYFGYYA